MQNLFYVGVTVGFCEGKEFPYSNWKVNSQTPLGKRRNIFQQKDNGDGNDENQFGSFQDGVEHHPFFESQVKITGRTTWNQHDVEKFHTPSSFYQISAPTKRQE
jgi:hypothetical protein